MDQVLNLAHALMALLFASVAVAAETPIRTSWESGPAGNPLYRDLVLQRHRDSGLNTMMFQSRIGGVGIFEVDAAGTVRMTGLNPQDSPNKIPLSREEDYVEFLQAADRYGVDVYLMEIFYIGEKRVLDTLGPSAKAFIGGYTRYTPFGPTEAPAPLEGKYWLGMLLESAKFAARLSLKCPRLKGLLFDTEMYGGGGMLYRTNCSFDDQTWSAACARMREHNRLPGGARPEEVAIAERYRWLEGGGLLEEYFQAQEDLVAEMARRFREELDAINPRFRAGMYPWLGNWFSNGWMRGLGTEQAPAIVLSAQEYGGLHAPDTLANIAQTRRLNANVRFLAGFMVHSGRHTPASLGRNIQRANALGEQGVDGYWIYSTTPVWQHEPEIIDQFRQPGARRLDWWITAPGAQFWEAIGRANATTNLPESELYRPGCLPPAGSVLLTGNSFYPGPRSSVAVKLTCEPPPDLPFHTQGTEMILGPGEAAWKPRAPGDTITVTADFGGPVTVDKLFLLAGHHSDEFFPIGGTLYLSTSLDGHAWLDFAEMQISGSQKLRMPFGQEDYGFVNELLGITARYLRLQFQQTDPAPDFPNVAKTFGAFAIGELAVWGRDAAGR